MMKRILLFITLVLPLFLAAQKTQKDSAINFVNSAVKNFPSAPLRASVINTAFAKTQRAIMDTLYRRGDSVFYKLNGVERLAFKDSTGGGGVTGLTNNYLVLGNSAGSAKGDSIFSLSTGIRGRYLLYNTQKSNAIQDVMFFKSPSTHANALGFRMRFHYSGNGDGTANTPMQFGFNGDGTDDPLQPGIGRQMEPRYISGGLKHVEDITAIYIPPSTGHPSGESIRTYMQTVKIRDSAGNSENQTDFRGTSFELKTLLDKGYFSAAGNGLGTTVGIRDVVTGYGMDYKTDGSASLLYNVGHGAGTGGIEVKWDSVNRFRFGPGGAPYLTINNPDGTANTWSNMQTEGLKIIRGGSPAKLQFMFSASTSIFDITADHTNGITSFYAPSGGYGMEFYANGTLTMALQYTGRVGIGTASPVASAALDITSTTRGLLIPRLDTAQRNAISSPAMGLQVVSTIDSTINMYDGTRWVAGAKILRGTVMIDIPSASPGTMVEATFTITGAQPGDQLLLSVANGSYPSDGYLDAFISGPNAATVRYINTSMLATVDFPSQPFKYQLFK